MGAICVGWIVKDQEHRAGLEPTSPHYGCGILAAGRPVLVVQVGLVGLEPTSTGLRDRRIASSATTPIVSGSGRNRTSGLDLIRVLLSPLSYAPSGAGGTRTRTCRIKSPVCCRYTTTPCLVGRMRLGRVNIASLLCPIVPSGSPENRTQRHVVISRVWATSPRLPQGQSGWQDSNLRSRAPRARGLPLPYIPLVSQNGRI